jgi:uncharacterized protein (DUF433 family)
MTREDCFDFPYGPTGQICLKGTGIGVEHVIEKYNLGRTFEEICDDLTDPEDAPAVANAIAYYRENPGEIDEYMAKWEAEALELRREIESTPANQALREKLRQAKRNSVLVP